MYVLLLTLLGEPTSRHCYIYRLLVRSILDYGSVVYGSARQSYLRILDPIQSHALRLCLGAFRTSPAFSLCVQANKPPLYIRRRMLNMQDSLRLGLSQIQLTILSTAQNFMLSCLPWMSFENLKKSTFSCSRTHIRV